MRNKWHSIRQPCVYCGEVSVIPLNSLSLLNKNFRSEISSTAAAMRSPHYLTFARPAEHSAEHLRHRHKTRHSLSMQEQRGPLRQQNHDFPQLPSQTIRLFCHSKPMTNIFIRSWNNLSKQGQQGPCFKNTLKMTSNSEPSKCSDLIHVLQL